MTNDGTQDPAAPPVLSDPLAGLVTGSRYEPEPLRVRVTEPPLPDISMVRAMASVLGEDSEFSLDAFTSATESATDAAADTATDIPAPAAPPADGSQSAAATQPTAPVERTIPGPRDATSTRAMPPVITPGQRARRVRMPSGRTRPQQRLSPANKGRSSAGSVTLILVLLLVMLGLAVVFLASLIDTIASVFD